MVPAWTGGNPPRRFLWWFVWSGRRYPEGSEPERSGPGCDGSEWAPRGTGSLSPRRKGSPRYAEQSWKEEKFYSKTMAPCWRSTSPVSSLTDSNVGRTSSNITESALWLQMKSLSLNFFGKNYTLLPHSNKSHHLDIHRLTSTGRTSIKRQMNQRDTTSVHMTLCSIMTCQTAGTFIFTSSPSTSWSVFSPSIAAV